MLAADEKHENKESKMIKMTNTNKTNITKYIYNRYSSVSLFLVSSYHISIPHLRVLLLVVSLSKRVATN